MEKFGTAKQSTDDNITVRKRISCQTSKATHTHAEYVTIITITFPLLRWLEERSSMLRHAYIACDVNSSRQSAAENHEM